MNDPIQSKTWKEFRATGLFWLLNSYLHLFGWVIVFEIENDEIINVRPARTSFRGFDEKSNTEGFKKVTGYLKNNINELVKEVES